MATLRAFFSVGPSRAKFRVCHCLLSAYLENLSPYVDLKRLEEFKTVNFYSIFQCHIEPVFLMRSFALYFIRTLHLFSILVEIWLLMVSHPFVCWIRVNFSLSQHYFSQKKRCWLMEFACARE